MTRRARPSAPKISLRRKQKALEDRISRLGVRRDALLNGLAANHDIDRVDQQLDEARRDLAELVTVRRAKVRAARKRVKARDDLDRHDSQLKAARERSDAIALRLRMLGQRPGAHAHVAAWLAWQLASVERKASLLAFARPGVEAAADRASRQRGKPIDRFSMLVGRSQRLTSWHLKVAEALHEAEAHALSAGRSRAGVSGRAGDGDGRIVVLCGPDGEISEETLGALAVAGVAARPALARWHKAARTKAKDGRKIDPPRTFDPKGVKAVRKVSDGGMAAIVDARRKHRSLWEMYFDAAADGVGGHPGFAQVVAFASERIVAGRDSVSAVCRDVLHVRKNRGLELLETAIVAGLEGVAPRLGFGDRAERALDSGTEINVQTPHSRKLS